MKIVTTIVETRKEHMMCDCGGEFVLDKDTAIFDLMMSALRSDRDLSHTCTKCGKKELFKTQYPGEYTVEVPMKKSKNIIHRIFRRKRGR